ELVKVALLIAADQDAEHAPLPVAAYELLQGEAPDAREEVVARDGAQWVRSLSLAAKSQPLQHWIRRLGLVVLLFARHHDGFLHAIDLHVEDLRGTSFTESTVEGFHLVTEDPDLLLRSLAAVEEVMLFTSTA